MSFVLSYSECGTCCFAQKLFLCKNSCSCKSKWLKNRTKTSSFQQVFLVFVFSVWRLCFVTPEFTGCALRVARPLIVFRLHGRKKQPPPFVRDEAVFSRVLDFLPQASGAPTLKPTPLSMPNAKSNACCRWAILEPTVKNLKWLRFISPKFACFLLLGESGSLRGSAESPRISWGRFCWNERASSLVYTVCENGCVHEKAKSH